MKLAIAIVLLAAAIVAADLRSPFSFPAAKDHLGLSEDCQRASSAFSALSDFCLEVECEWNENTTFTEIAELFEVQRFLKFLIKSTTAAFHLLIF